MSSPERCGVDVDMDLPEVVDTQQDVWRNVATDGKAVWVNAECAEFAHCYLGQWARAANYAKLLINESKWSRCVYTYLLCILFAADSTCETTKRNETVAALAKKVNGLRQRIAGKSIPVEKYCSKKANRFVAKKSLMFAHYEFMYFWSGFDIVGGNLPIMQAMLEDIESIWLMRKSGEFPGFRICYEKPPKDSY
ncbi:hypothetical protein NECAME_02939 [Necator americanus]|uniref:Uncharacterized protein n=1 Tax=Necator americanus TaxID=51031 RepID=W2T8N5_NECAM|nr:hypothetical protein NECAME_02939 [Necator americanus]ETN78233.1 hypothetical protein NECAME_02939 [Necator americanus]